jgi:hypothetical protein
MVVAAGYDTEGADNDTALASIIQHTLGKLAQHAGCFVFGVDHFGKAIDTGTRGSSAKEGNADVVLALLGDKEISGAITNTRLALRKRRSGPNGEEFPFKPRVIDMGVDQHSKPLTTLVLDWEKTPGPKSFSTSKEDARWTKSLRMLRQALMNTLIDHGQDRRPWADGPTVRAVDADLVRNEFYRTHLAEGTPEQKQAAKQKAFRRAVNDAQAKKLVGILDDGNKVWMWLAAQKDEPSVGSHAPDA